MERWGKKFEFGRPIARPIKIFFVGAARWPPDFLPARFARAPTFARKFRQPQNQKICKFIEEKGLFCIPKEEGRSWTTETGRF